MWNRKKWHRKHLLRQRQRRIQHQEERNKTSNKGGKQELLKDFRKEMKEEHIVNFRKFWTVIKQEEEE